MPTVQEYHDTAVKAWQDAAEVARQAHHAAACQENYGLYKRSEHAFKAACDVAYPEIGGAVLYNLWIDSMESVAYYVELWSKMDADERKRWS